MKTLKPKTTIILLTALVALVYFWLFLNRYLYKPKAAAEKVNVTFVPTSGDFKVEERKTLDVIIQTTDSSKKISGLDLSFTASGSLSILGLTPPAPYPPPPVDQPTKLAQNQIIYDVSEKQARIAYAFLNPDSELPAALIMKMDFKGTASGSGKIKLETTKSQIVGNTTGSIYEFGKIDETNFNFSGQTTTSPTPTIPISSVTPVPTVNPNCLCKGDDTCDPSCNFIRPGGSLFTCSLLSSLFSTPPTQDNKNSWCRRTLRPQGDADGNGTVEKVDYYYYVAAVNGGKIPVSVNPDFNGDGEVGVADRGIITNTLNNPPQCKVDSDCPIACPQPACQEDQTCPTSTCIRHLCLNGRCVEKPLCPKNLGTPGTPSMPNPASVYCKVLGYTNKIVNTDQGQIGMCVFLDNSECDEWKFFQGKCGEKFTYCEKFGHGKIEISTQGCSYTQECAWCVLPNGKKCLDWDYCSGSCYE